MDRLVNFVSRFFPFFPNYKQHVQLLLQHGSYSRYSQSIDNPLSSDLLYSFDCWKCQLNNQPFVPIDLIPADMSATDIARNNIPLTELAEIIESHREQIQDTDHMVDIVLVGMNPHVNEIQQNRPFVGDSGRLLRQTIDRIRNEDERLAKLDIAIINSVQCFIPGNGNPDLLTLYNCRKLRALYLYNLRPKIIVYLGKHAFQAGVCIDMLAELGAPINDEVVEQLPITTISWINNQLFEYNPCKQFREQFNLKAFRDRDIAILSNLQQIADKIALKPLIGKFIPHLWDFASLSDKLLNSELRYLFTLDTVAYHPSYIIRQRIALSNKYAEQLRDAFLAVYRYDQLFDSIRELIKPLASNIDTSESINGSANRQQNDNA